MVPELETATCTGDCSLLEAFSGLLGVSRATLGALKYC